ncbi:MAG: dihydroneopterin aldolase [Quinella sp. 2Q5]|nr:dihydroneopterin aldolase [Quinella sp. 2Q5]
MADKILLTGLKVSGKHGCSEAERKKAQPFVVDAELHLNLNRAGKSDDLGDTIDYVSVIGDIKKIIGGAPRNLIETVAQDITDLLLRRYLLLDAVKITLRKVSPPVDEKFSGAAVEIFRSRER